MRYLAALVLLWAARFAGASVAGSDVGSMVQHSLGRSQSSAVADEAAPLGQGDTPQFKFCYDRRGPCGVPKDGVKLVYLGDILQHAGCRGDPPVVLQIGSAGLKSPDAFVDVDLHERALQKLPHDSVRFIFVDANPENEQSVRERAATLPVQSRQVSFVAGMVSDTCTSKRSVMHGISSQAAKDFGLDSNIITNFQGLHVSAILNSIRGYAQQKLDPHWQAFSRAPNLTAYITERVSRCISTETLLAEAGVTPDRIAMFIVDAETADYVIVDSFLRSTDFRPGYMQYELWSSWNSSRHTPLVRKLRARGYTVGRSFDTTDANNVFAYLPRQK